MTRKHLLPGVVLITSSLALASCALVSRGETLQVRYFTLEQRGAATQTPAAAKSELELRLGRVDASGGLGEQLAVRTGQNELTYREDQRWTERPAQFVRRGLERALFEERGLTRAYSGAVPTLDVELVELEMDQSSTPTARVRLVARLHDERRGLCQDSFASSEPVVRGEGSEPVAASVASLSNALQRSLDQLATRVVQCLSSREQAASAQPAPASAQPSDAADSARASRGE